MRDDFVIVGTAGHIDHGKTALVRALTGVETDRTKEEKDRGISIDIGFAPFVLPDGQRLGLVDVPGHERFIRNMLAGAGGVDLVLLVVDAREGVMPQTREHLAILELLGVTHGVVVLTKMDLVDAEWLDLVREEVLAEVVDSFLRDAPIVPVSSVTGAGIEELKTVIAKMLPAIERKPREGAFRMPIDRVFSVTGFGTVVTGTVWRGHVGLGDALVITPSEEPVRVRSLQVHGEPVGEAQAGQRVAIALTSVRGTVRRGMTLGAAGAFQPTRLLDVRLTLLRDSDTLLSHRQRVRVHAGTAEVLGRVLLLDETDLHGGESAYAQLLLESEMVVLPRDHLVVRSYSPVHTLGGGIVIDPHPSRLHRRHRAEIVLHLRRKEEGTPQERVQDALVKEPLLSLDALATQLELEPATVGDVLQTLFDGGWLVQVGPARVPVSVWQQWQRDVQIALQSLYDKNRFDVWLSRSVAVQAVRMAGATGAVAERAVAEMVRQGALEEHGERIRLPGHKPLLNAVEIRIRDDLQEALAASPLDPPARAELESRHPGRDRIVRNVLHALAEEGILESLGPDEQYILVSALEQVEAVCARLDQAQGSFSVAQVRDQTGMSRKWTVLVLEHFDRQKKTRRTGDSREFLGVAGRNPSPIEEVVS